MHLGHGSLLAAHCLHKNDRRNLKLRQCWRPWVYQFAATFKCYCTSCFTKLSTGETNREIQRRQRSVHSNAPWYVSNKTVFLYYDASTCHLYGATSA